MCCVPSALDKCRVRPRIPSSPCTVWRLIYRGPFRGTDSAKKEAAGSGAFGKHITVGLASPWPGELGRRVEGSHRARGLWRRGVMEKRRRRFARGKKMKADVVSLRQALCRQERHRSRRFWRLSRRVLATTDLDVIPCVHQQGPAAWMTVLLSIISTAPRPRN